MPGATIACDSVGNMTQDNLGNTYSYDAEGRPVSAAGVQTTFDAFGRALELNHNGTYTQMVYTPSGWRHTVMNGQALSSGWIRWWRAWRRCTTGTIQDTSSMPTGWGRRGLRLRRSQSEHNAKANLTSASGSRSDFNPLVLDPTSSRPALTCWEISDQLGFGEPRDILRSEA
ncbi:MAG TPA: hypothetical protein VFC29_23715 [Candidatus Limnocylindrales bacterium]|nr:hypothetical protein [Candidatus Limnocylindrales bacterium]